MISTSKIMHHFVCRRPLLACFAARRLFVFDSAYKSGNMRIYDRYSSCITIRHFSSVVPADSNFVLTPSSADKQSGSKRQDEKRDAKTLLELITEKARLRGTELVFSEAFEETLDRSPVSFLLNYCTKLKMDYIAEAFAIRPKFLEYPTTKWEEVLKTFKMADVSPGIALAALVGHPEIFELDPKEITCKLVQLSTLGIRDRILSSVLAKRPQIISCDIQKIAEFFENMKSFFPKKKLLVLVRKDPEILLTHFDNLEAKYEYVYNEMGLEAANLFQSERWYRMALSDIECRHLFLVRCGVYVTPDEKKADVAKGNPSLRLILDTDDEEFSSRVAGVTLLEWNTFKQIYASEEPLEVRQVDAEYLKRTKRIAPRTSREEWEDLAEETPEPQNIQNVLGEVTREDLEGADDDDDEGEDYWNEDDVQQLKRQQKPNFQHPERRENVSFKAKRHFRKRGVFLASPD